jgi:hypothetical protein
MDVQKRLEVDSTAEIARGGYTEDSRRRRAKGTLHKCHNIHVHIVEGERFKLVHHWSECVA